MIWALLVVATIAACELLARLPILDQVHRAAETAGRAATLVANSKVSDHWKERVLPRYALRIAGASLAAFALLVCALIPYIALVYTGPLLGADVGALLLNGWIILGISAGAMSYFLVRSHLPGGGERKKKKKAKSPGARAEGGENYGYSRTARVLHRLALSSPERGELLYQLECSSAPPPPADPVEGRHVFVAGLARAGTTVLMRAIYESGRFASLTYRDMPFVMAPNLWARLSGRSQRQIARTERAHGDGVLVDFDSPEALEEPFWRTFCGDDYIRADGLVAHDVTFETIQKYRAFVGHVLARYGATRYLAKNNNNILRLSVLRAAFPNAVILIPFRAPRAQCFSLQRQHARFVADNDRFTRDYMTWLAHHEFGLDQRPFVVEGYCPVGDANGAEYWLSMWTAVHRHLMAQVQLDGVGLIPIAYEDLCSADQAPWRAVCGRIDIPGTDRNFTKSRANVLASSNPSLRDEAEDLYRRLQILSRERLGLIAETKRRA